MMKYVLVIFLIVTFVCSERIYFTADLDGNWDIFSMEPNGKRVNRITETEYDEKDLCLSEDRSKLLYACSDGVLRVINLADNSIVDSVFTKDRNIKFHPSFYGNGIIYSTLTDFKRDIFSVAQRRGQRTGLLLELRSSVFHPVQFSEKEFMFTYQHCSIGCQGYITELWMFNPDKRPTCRQLTMHGAHVIDPVTLNDTTVLYSANPHDKMDIYTLDLNSKMSKPFIVTEYNDVCPKPSPSREDLAFIRKDKGKTSIIIKKLHDKKEICLNPLPCRYMSLAW